MKRISPLLVGVIMATLAPILVLSVLGLAYVGVVAISQDLAWSVALDQGQTALVAYQAYLSFLTIIPLALGIVGIIKAARQRHAE